MSNTANSHILFHTAEVVYVKDSDRTALILPDSKQIYVLQGVEIPIWDWLNLNYSYTRLIGMLAALLSVSDEMAAEQLYMILLKWEEKGILVQRITADG